MTAKPPRTRAKASPTAFDAFDGCYLAHHDSDKIPFRGESIDRQVRALCSLYGLQATRRGKDWTVARESGKVIGKTTTDRSLESWIACMKAWGDKQGRYRYT